MSGVLEVRQAPTQPLSSKVEYARLLADSKRHPCTRWTGAMLRNGYGTTTVDGRTELAHRAAYVAAFGPIPAGLHIDHLCRVRACVNAVHLQAVTQAENNRRVALTRTACPQGHAYDEANTRTTSTGSRVRRACHRARENARYAAKRRAAA